jgi:hypothetical protein
MNLDPRAEMTLELSRLAQEPSVTDRARNLEALRERLGLPLPPAGAGGPVATNELPRPSELPASRGAGKAGVASGKLVPFAAVAVMAAAVGFFAGSRLDAPERAAQQQPAAQQHASVTIPPPAAREADVPGANSAGDAQRAEADHKQPPEPAAAEVKRSAARRDRHNAPGARDVRSEPVARATKATPEAEDTTFFEAVRLLRRARSALSKGEPQLTLALLDELDERFPRTLLDEERGATRVLALCAHGQSAAAEALARQLFARHPRSIYTPRLAQSCAASAVRAASSD